MQEWRNIIYVDNAATSYPKPKEVISGINAALTAPFGNPGRGAHGMALNAQREVFEAREAITKFFGIKKETCLAFTKNATEALNYGIFGFLRKGDHVITTSMEHNSVLRPLHYLEQKRIIQCSIVKANQKGEVDPEAIQHHFKKNTKMVAVTFSSNVNGTKMPILDIAGLKRMHDFLLLVDGSQGAGTEEIDVEKMSIDILAFPGHKGLMGPQGTGGIYIRDGLKAKPTIMGGTGSISESLLQPDFMPDVLESGTLNLPGIIGLRKGVEFIQTVGRENIRAHKSKLLSKLFKSVEHMDGLIKYSLADGDKNTGIFALEIKGLDSSELGYALDKLYNIKTRTGYHCAPLAHKSLGSFGHGLVRISFGYFNTEQEVDLIAEALTEISRNLQESSEYSL